ncbi:MAG TPA: GNAT family N-acetyltransferase, partial [Acidimicrobiales bacterium]|nr:GNAT family N-acetyltransferase [Acidimicrobiales bacterium]
AKVAALGFYDDPVMSWVFPDDDTRGDALPVAFHGLAQRTASQQGRIDLLEDSCTALWLPPDPPEAGATDPPSAEEMGHFTSEVVERFMTLQECMDANHPKEPHWYLGVIATLPEAQGRGLGAKLLAPVLEMCDREGWPAYLESSNARNLPFYFRHGWVQTGEIRVPDGPLLFPMWRDPRPAK